MLFTSKIRFLAALLLAAAISLVATAEAARRRPSLDGLVKRASTFWDLLAKGRKDQALQYVQPQSRDNYLAGQIPAFSEPRITSLELSPVNGEVWVTVKVRRFLPPITAPFDWPVKEKWVFEKGSWVVVIPRFSTAFNAGADNRPQTPAGDADQIERDRRAINEALHFESSTIDFGTVRQGRAVPVELKYRLTGSENMAWDLEGAPQALWRSRSGDRELVPGEEKKIELEFRTERYDGAVSEKFAVLVGRGGVKVPYEFSLQGSVYTPLSIAPRPLRFRKGESTADIILKNNSKSEIRLLAVRKSAFGVEPLPQALAPGAECRLTVRLKIESHEPNHVDEIPLRFAEPVDGMPYLLLPVIVNYEPVDTSNRPFWERPAPPSEPHP